MRIPVLIGLALALTGCASAQAIRTSGNTMVVQATADPSCGADGAAQVAALTVAVETIKAGYSRYIINGGEAENNVQVSRGPGRIETAGTFTQSGGATRYRESTTFVPGRLVVSGSHDQRLQVTMFRAGDVGYDQAVDAQQTLGPDWQERVKNGIRTCL